MLSYKQAPNQRLVLGGGNDDDEDNSCSASVSSQLTENSCWQEESSSSATTKRKEDKRSRNRLDKSWDHGSRESGSLRRQQYVTPRAEKTQSFNVPQHANAIKDETKVKMAAPSSNMQKKKKDLLQVSQGGSVSAGSSRSTRNGCDHVLIHHDTESRNSFHATEEALPGGKKDEKVVAGKGGTLFSSSSSSSSRYNKSSSSRTGKLKTKKASSSRSLHTAMAIKDNVTLSTDTTSSSYSTSRQDKLRKSIEKRALPHKPSKSGANSALALWSLTVHDDDTPLSPSNKSSSRAESSHSLWTLPVDGDSVPLSPSNTTSSSSTSRQDDPRKSKANSSQSLWTLPVDEDSAPLSPSKHQSSMSTEANVTLSTSNTTPSSTSRHDKLRKSKANSPRSLWTLTAHEESAPLSPSNILSSTSNEANVTLSTSSTASSSSTSRHDKPRMSKTNSSQSLWTLNVHEDSAPLSPSKHPSSMSTEANETLPISNTTSSSSTSRHDKPRKSKANTSQSLWTLTVHEDSATLSPSKHPSSMSTEANETLPISNTTSSSSTSRQDKPRKNKANSSQSLWTLSVDEDSAPLSPSKHQSSMSTEANVTSPTSNTTSSSSTSRHDKSRKSKANSSQSLWTMTVHEDSAPSSRSNYPSSTSNEANVTLPTPNTTSSSSTSKQSKLRKSKANSSRSQWTLTADGDIAPSLTTGQTLSLSNEAELTLPTSNTTSSSSTSRNNKLRKSEAISSHSLKIFTVDSDSAPLSPSSTSNIANVTLSTSSASSLSSTSRLDKLRKSKGNNSHSLWTLNVHEDSTPLSPSTNSTSRKDKMKTSRARSSWSMHEIDNIAPKLSDYSSRRDKLKRHTCVRSMMSSTTAPTTCTAKDLEHSTQRRGRENSTSERKMAKSRSSLSLPEEGKADSAEDEEETTGHRYGRPPANSTTETAGRPPLVVHKDADTSTKENDTRMTEEASLSRTSDHSASAWSSQTKKWRKERLKKAEKSNVRSLVSNKSGDRSVKGNTKNANYEQSDRMQLDEAKTEERKDEVAKTEPGEPGEMDTTQSSRAFQPNRNVGDEEVRYENINLRPVGVELEMVKQNLESICHDLNPFDTTLVQGSKSHPELNSEEQDSIQKPSCENQENQRCTGHLLKTRTIGSALADSKPVVQDPRAYSFASSPESHYESVYGTQTLSNDAHDNEARGLIESQAEVAVARSSEPQPERCDWRNENISMDKPNTIDSVLPSDDNPEACGQSELESIRAECCAAVAASVDRADERLATSEEPKPSLGYKKDDDEDSGTIDRQAEFAALRSGPKTDRCGDATNDAPKTFDIMGFASIQGENTRADDDRGSKDIALSSQASHNEESGIENQARFDASHVTEVQHDIIDAVNTTLDNSNMISGTTVGEENADTGYQPGSSGSSFPDVGTESTDESVGKGSVRFTAEEDTAGATSDTAICRGDDDTRYANDDTLIPIRDTTPAASPVNTLPARDTATVGKERNVKIMVKTMEETISRKNADSGSNGTEQLNANTLRGAPFCGGDASFVHRGDDDTRYANDGTLIPIRETTPAASPVNTLSGRDTATVGKERNIKIMVKTIEETISRKSADSGSNGTEQLDANTLRGASFCGGDASFDHRGDDDTRYANDGTLIPIRDTTPAASPVNTLPTRDTATVGKERNVKIMVKTMEETISRKNADGGSNGTEQLNANTLRGASFCGGDASFVHRGDDDTRNANDGTLIPIRETTPAASPVNILSGRDTATVGKERNIKIMVKTIEETISRKSADSGSIGTEQLDADTLRGASFCVGDVSFATVAMMILVMQMMALSFPSETLHVRQAPSIHCRLETRPRSGRKGMSRSWSRQWKKLYPGKMQIAEATELSTWMLTLFAELHSVGEMLHSLTVAMMILVMQMMALSFPSERQHLRQAPSIHCRVETQPRSGKKGISR